MNRRVQAFSPVILSPAGDPAAWTPPTSLEWMPAGEHTIHAREGSRAATIKCMCTEEDARVLDAQLQQALQRAASGQQSRPFIDADHDGREAMAIPKRFFWDEGIRLEVEWTAAGEAALRGRTYSYFSPEWYHGDNNHPVGIPEVGPIGALTNTPAFQTIERLAAKISEGATSSTNKPNKADTMEQLMKVLVEAKLIPSVKLDDAEAAVMLKASLGQLTETHSATIRAKDSELSEMRVQLTEAVEARTAAIKAEAEAIVAEAVKAGKIKDDSTLRGTWVSLLVKDKSSATAMLSSIDVVRKASNGREPLPEDGGEDKETQINRLTEQLKSEKNSIKAGLLVQQLRKVRNGEAKN